MRDVGYVTPEVKAFLIQHEKSLLTSVNDNEHTEEEDLF